MYLRIFVFICTFAVALNSAFAASTVTETWSGFHHKNVAIHLEGRTIEIVDPYSETADYSAYLRIACRRFKPLKPNPYYDTDYEPCVDFEKNLMFGGDKIHAHLGKSLDLDMIDDTHIVIPSLDLTFKSNANARMCFALWVWYRHKEGGMIYRKPMALFCSKNDDKTAKLYVQDIGFGGVPLAINEFDELAKSPIPIFKKR